MTRSSQLLRPICPVQRHIRFNSTGPIQVSSVLKPPQLDFSGIVDNADAVRQNCLARKAPGLAAVLPDVIRLNQRRIQNIQALIPLEQKRNILNKQISNVKHGDRRTQLLGEAVSLKTEISKLKFEYDETIERLTHIASALPNQSHPGVPKDEKEIGKIGIMQEKSVLNDHIGIAESLDLLDLPAAARATGHAWYYLKGMGVQLELALVSYAIELAMKRGWKLVKPPDAIRTEIALACGFHPRDEQGDQIYQLSNVTIRDIGLEADESTLCLAGTAEIPLAAMHINTMFEEDRLPIKYVGVGTAYRAEAASRGREAKGLYRVHQFTKVELFAWTTQDESDGMLEEILSLQREIVEGLGLHARILDMPPHELGNAAYRKYDVEAWMYGRQGWGEIMSASNCTDYQSRRLHTRYRGRDGKVAFAHTLNGTAIAVPRMIIAILESGLREDGTVEIPKVLQKFVGREIISKT